MIGKYWTIEAATIKSQVRDLVEILGDIKEEQVFSAWVAANNLMFIHIVCESLDWDLVDRCLPVHSTISPYGVSHYCVEYRIAIDMNEWTKTYNLNRQKLTNIKDRKGDDEKSRMMLNSYA